MNFALYGGKPYAIVKGKFHPCVIFENGYHIGGTPLDIAAKGCLSEEEVKARLGYTGGELSSIASVKVQEAPKLAVPKIEPDKAPVKAGTKATAAVTRKR